MENEKVPGIYSGVIALNTPIAFASTSLVFEFKQYIKFFTCAIFLPPPYFGYPVTEFISTTLPNSARKVKLYRS